MTSYHALHDVVKNVWSEFKKKHMLGVLSNEPAKTILKQLDQVRQKVNKTQELTQKYNKQMDDVTLLNKKLASGYINNLNVIVDLSRLLTEYRDTMGDILEAMRTFDESLMRNNDIQHIKDLTSEKLHQVNDFFKTDVKQVHELLKQQGRHDVAQRLFQSKDNFDETYKQSMNTILNQDGGKKGGRPKK